MLFFRNSFLLITWVGDQATHDKNNALSSSVATRHTEPLSGTALREEWEAKERSQEWIRKESSERIK
jgi:hypothetical protein